MNTAKFIIIHYNINSILHEGRIEEPFETCSTMKVSVLCITESKLDKTVSMNRILLPEYHEPIGRDRFMNGITTRSGGCLIYVKTRSYF